MRPKDAKRLNGRIWYREKSKLTLKAARALKKKLIRNNKKSRVTHNPQGYEVWWTERIQNV